MGSVFFNTLVFFDSLGRDGGGLLRRVGFLGVGTRGAYGAPHFATGHA
jgi:hypothetical protein